MWAFRMIRILQLIPVRKLADNSQSDELDLSD